MKIPRATHSSLPLSILWGVMVMSLSLASLSCSGSGDGTPSPTASTASGTNVVTGIMPASSTVAQRTEFSFTTLVADAFHWLTTTDSAFAVSKGRVEIVGTAIKAYPVGNGRFELLNVPDGPVTILFVSPDDVSGTLNLFLPSGGNAVIDLGKVTIWNGRATPEYEPSHENSLYPGFLQARGAVSGLSASFSTPPANGACEPFVVAGVTFCFDEHTQFTPPLSSQKPFDRTSVTNEVAVVTGSPTDDPNSNVFRAKSIQRNHGAASANDNTVEAVAPITGLGQRTITLFGTPLKPDDNDPNTSDVNAHAITFDTAKAKFNPRSLENQLSRGLVVGIETPKNNRSGPAVTTTQAGVQVAEADRVRLIRLGNDHCTTGEFIHVQGKVFSPHAPTQTFGITTLSGFNLFVQVQTTTRFDEPLTKFEDLKDGMIVEVFALPPVTPGAGLRALLIDEAADLGEIEIRGVVSSVDTTNKKFVVAGMTFCYDSGCDLNFATEFVGLTPPPQVGQFLEILGAAPTPGESVIKALRVELEQDPRPSSCSDGNGNDDQS